MDLSKITARVRPRNPYEAADLGIVMARQWFRPLMLLWLIPSLPLMLVLFFLFRDQPIWAVLILWWLKPLWETLQLQFIAEALFNPDAQWRDVLKQTPKLLRHQWLPKLFVHRWSLSRSFNMPVGELERLSGAQRSRRILTLHRGDGSASVWLTIMGNTIEGLLVTALFSLAWMLVPVEMSVDFEIDDLLNSPLLFPTLAWSGYVAMWVIAPFYVCCGFMLYINRRTWLEAWDIELTFRQLAARQLTAHQQTTRHDAPVKNIANQTAPVLLLGLILLGNILHPSSAQAASADTSSSVAASSVTTSATTGTPASTANTITDTLSPEQSQQQIAEILESDVFNEIKTRNSLRWIEDKDDKKNPGDDDGSSWFDNFDWLKDWLKDTPETKGALDWLAGLPAMLEVLLWGLVIALLAYLIYRFRDFAGQGFRRATPQAKAAPTHLFGMELHRDSLPDDVIAAARALWQQQQTREALGLLYRAALSFLVYERLLPLESSHTEDECVNVCSQQEDAARAGFFRQLTQHWIRLAYAHQAPDTAAFDKLCEHWDGFVQTESAQ